MHERTIQQTKKRLLIKFETASLNENYFIFLLQGTVMHEPAIKRRITQISSPIPSLHPPIRLHFPMATHCTLMRDILLHHGARVNHLN